MRGRWILAGIVGGAAWMAVRRPFRVLVEGESMLPTLRPGDQLLCVRSGAVRRGEVVVLRHPSHRFEMVKRVVGLPGEILTRGGREERLGPDEYLVVGDNAAGSTDGRSFGPVRRPDIAGLVRFRYLPEPRRLSRPRRRPRLPVLQPASRPRRDVEGTGATGSGRGARRPGHG